MTDQYIIKEKDWDTVLNKATFKKKDWVYINKITDAIFSHPYNPQADDKICFGKYDDCPCEDECDTAKDCCKQTKLLQALESQKEQSIRQSEREKVLDELTKWCKQQWFEVESDEGETYSVIHVGDILAILEELRQEGKP